MKTVEQFTIEEMEQRAAEWAEFADELRNNICPDGRQIRFAQDAAVKWMMRAQRAQRVQQGII